MTPRTGPAACAWQKGLNLERNERRTGGQEGGEKKGEETVEDVRNRVYAVREITLAQTRTGGSYLRLALWDGCERVEGRVWDGAMAEGLAGQVKAGDVLVVVEARWAQFAGEKQLNIAAARPAQPGEYDPMQLRPKKEGIPAVSDLIALMDTVRRWHLRSLLDAVFTAELLREFEAAPAAKGTHHNYAGGLLEHTLEVIRLCDAACSVYGKLDRDLLVTGAALHDVGKLQEYDSSSVTFERTDPGRLLGHIVMGWDLVRRAWVSIPGFPEQEGLHLEHLVLSHHGQREWGSPTEPCTPEAVALHHADLASARINQALEAVSGVACGWTPKDVSGRSFWVPVS